jgi:hypothetical protein
MEKSKRLRKQPLAQCPLMYLTGRWINNSGSPPVRIYKGSHSYHIEFEYPDGTKVDTRITVILDKMIFDMFGRIELAYDEENDWLLVASEGIYKREMPE